MGKIEERGKKRARKRNFKSAILKTVAVAGVLSIALVAPNVIGAMRKLGVDVLLGDTSAVARARRRLVKNGLLAYDGKLLRLTQKGEVALRRLTLEEYATMPHGKWDGRWRVLIFDVPEYRRGVREQIRRTLNVLGFERLQDSVWVYPYDCEDLVTLLKADFKIGKDMLYMIVDELEHDKAIRKKFSLEE